MVDVKGTPAIEWCGAADGRGSVCDGPFEVEMNLATTSIAIGSKPEYVMLCAMSKQCGGRQMGGTDSCI